MAHKHARKGFFFTVMALAMLSFMLLTVQVWVRTFEQSDLRSSQRFRGEAVQQILSVVSDKSLSEFANASAFFATYKLVNYTSTQAGALARLDAEDNIKNPGTGQVEETLRQLMLNGTYPSTLTGTGPYSDAEHEAYAIESWQDKMRISANVMGFSLSFSNVTNFTVRQLDPWTVGVHFEIHMNITDFDRTMFQSRNLTADANFSISGFDDPFVRRKSLNGGHVDVGRQIFRGPHETPSSVQPHPSTAMRGAGWFFGPVRQDYPSPGEDVSYLSQYILAYKYDENFTSYMNMFGAAIVTDKPVIVTNETVISGCRFNVVNETKCINCLVHYVPLDAENESKPECATLQTPGDELYNKYDKPYLGGPSSLPLTEVSRPSLQSYLLIDNWVNTANEQEVQRDDSQYYHRAWDMTNIRDMAICGLYVASPTGPSFFQRMTDGPWDPSKYGIESFVIGKWAGGAEDPASPSKCDGENMDLMSRLDWEFYSCQKGTKVKGMMGCKNVKMCQEEAAVQESVGHFAITGPQASADRYGLGEILCGIPDGLHAQC